MCVWGGGGGINFVASTKDSPPVIAHRLSSCTGVQLLFL